MPELDPFEREEIIAELEVLRTEFDRVSSRAADMYSDYIWSKHRADRILKVKQHMHDRLDALYRRTKAERDQAAEQERQRILTAVKAMHSGCHSHSGLNCEHDWFDGYCSLIDGHEVITIIRGEA